MRMRSSGVAVLGLTGVMFMGTLALTSAAPKKAAKPAPKADAATIAAGKKVYDDTKCMLCHNIGKGAKKVGPDLTHIGKTWSEAKLTTVVRNPKKLNPNSKMPAYGPDRINDKDLKALVAYMKSLK